MKHRSRILLLGLLLLMLGNFAIALVHPQKALAASTADAVDRATIKVGDSKFADADIDSQFQYREQAPSDGCEDIIDGFDNSNDFHPGKTPSSATITISTPSGAGSSKCVKRQETVNFNNRDNFLIGFVWIDKNTIKGADGKLTFKRDKSSDIFISSKDRGGCSDTLTVGGDNKTATLVARQGDLSIEQSNTSEPPRQIADDDYDWYPFERPSNHPGDWKWNKDKECWESAPVTAARLGGTPDKGSDGAAEDLAAQAQSTDSCESKSGLLSWIMCPISQAIDQALDWVDKEINALLAVDNNVYTDDRLHSAWGQIRNIAFIILVPIMLVMVIGTAVGYSGLDAYTVKRAMPRLLIAVVFIALSWSVVTFLIQLSNVVGQGTMGLITLPFRANPPFDNYAHLTLSTLYGGSIWQLALVPILTIGLMVAFWLFGATLLLAAGVAFLVLLLRQLFIIALMLAAPIAILSWIFPGNDKPWKLWWDVFSKLLMMYPLIISVIAVGRIFAYLIHNDAGGGAGFGGIIQPFAILIVWFLPYALIPLTFRFAGGFFATLTGMVNDRSKGIFDRQRQARANKLQRTSQGRLFKGAPPTGFRARLNRVGGQVMHANQAGVNPFLWNARTQAGAIDAQRGQVQAMMEDEHNGFKKDDDLSRAAADSKDAADLREILRNNYADRYTDANGNFDTTAMERDVSRVEQMRRKYGNDTFRMASWRQAVAGGTAYNSSSEAWEAAGRIAHGDGALLADMVGQGRGDAMGGGRVDQGGAGFNATRQIAQRSVNGWTVSEKEAEANPEFGPAGTHYTAEEYTRVPKDANGNPLLDEYGDPQQSVAQRALARAVVEAQGGGVLSHGSMKPQAVKNIIPQVRKRIEAAVASGNTDAIDRELAFAASLQDSLSGSSPQLAREFGDKVMLHQIDAVNDKGQRIKVTVGKAVESRRGSTVFQSTRREYQNASQEANRPKSPPPGAAAAGPPGGDPNALP